MKLNADTTIAGIVAHAIRQGKRPQVGMVIDCLVNWKSVSEEDLKAGRLENAKDETQPRRIAFVVEQRHIDAAIRLINEQRATYREPKTTTIRFDKDKE